MKIEIKIHTNTVREPENITIKTKGTNMREEISLKYHFFNTIIRTTNIGKINKQ